jgi:hypothetical protein
MTVGNQASQASVNQALTSLALALRDVMQNIQDVSNYVGSVGPAGLIALGFGSADVAPIQAFIGNMNSLAVIYGGGASPIGLPFNFEANTYPLWAAS